MKTFKTIATLLFCLVLLFGTTSCVVFVKRDNGRHNGWFKNPPNPHKPQHPNNTNLGKFRRNPNK